MTTQLPLDILFMIAEEIAIPSKPKAALNFSLVSRKIHDFTYPLILRADALANPADLECTSSCFENDIWDYWGEPLSNEPDETSPSETPDRHSSLEFFIKLDNPTLLGRFLDHTGTSINALIHLMGRSRPCGNLLLQAVTSGAVSVVKFLLKEGANFVPPSREYGYPTHPLDEAISKNHVPITKLLLEYGALRDYVDYHGYDDERKDRKILKWIASSGTSLAIAESLISHCSDVNYSDPQLGATAIHELVCRYDPEKPDTVSNFRGKMELLIQAGANIDAIRDGFHRRTALDMACHKTWSYPIQVLLELGASTGGVAGLDKESNYLYQNSRSARSSRSSTEATPLHILLIPAAYEWQGRENQKELQDELVKSAKLLLDYGLLQGQPGCFDRDQSANFFRVCASLRSDLSELWTIIIAFGMLDVHSRNDFGQTLLSQLAARCYGVEKVERSGPYWKPNLVRALVVAGSDPNTIDQSGMTPLHWAIFYGDFDLVKLLIELGANPLKEVDGAAPVHYAFGKPFPGRGPIAQKVMSKLCYSWARRFPRCARRDKIEGSQFLTQLSEGRCHPLLSSFVDPLILREAKHMAAANERRFFSIMALLFQFGESIKDENGLTPREIAESAGVLRAGETLKLCIDQKDTPPQGVAISEYLASIQEKHLKRATGRFGKSFPKSLCGPSKWRARPVPLVLVTTTPESGRHLYAPTIARFRSQPDRDLEKDTANDEEETIDESNWELLEQGYLHLRISTGRKEKEKRMYG